MAKDAAADNASFFDFGLYKPSQGRITRQVTAAALGIGFALAAWRLNVALIGTSPVWLWQYLLPGILLVAGLWFSFRIVKWRKFADFLIAVEAEMNKVSWPTRAELFRASGVVIVLIFAMAALLFVYDLLWRAVFQWLGIVY